MYVFEGAGYTISLCDADKEKIENGEDLRTTFKSKKFGETKFVFRVREYAEPDADQMKFDWYEHPPNMWLRQDIVEPGFWIEVYPFLWENVGGVPERDFERHVKNIEELVQEDRTFRDLIILTIDRERWKRLCTNGEIVTRSTYDRFDIALHAKDVPYPRG